MDPSDAPLVLSMARERLLNASVDFLRKSGESPGTQDKQGGLRFQVSGSEELDGFVLHKSPDGIGSERRSKWDIEQLESRHDQDQNPGPLSSLEQTNSADDSGNREQEEKYS